MSETEESGREEQPSSMDEGEIYEVLEVDSRDLLQGGRELRIVHGDEVYRLLLTRNNKLILQK